MTSATGWRGTGAHQFPDTAADPFTRATIRWRLAQEIGAEPLPLIAGEVLELPRPRSRAWRAARVFVSGGVFFTSLGVLAFVLWIATGTR